MTLFIDMKQLRRLCFVITMLITMLDTSKGRSREIEGDNICRAALAEKVFRHVNALIVVDVQNCFITGNLALANSPAHQDGAEVVPIINHLIQTIPFHVIVYTHDWHPRNHISFYENLEPRRQYLTGDRNRTIQMFDEVTYTGPKFETEQVLWPAHCMQETDDAALHKNLHVDSANNVVHIRKGIDPDIDSYSAFADNNQGQKTELDDKLRERHVTHVFVAGLATDYCVAATALDAFNLNYTTYLIEDASRGVALETIKSKLADLKRRGVVIIQTNQVKALTNSASETFLNPLLLVSVYLLT